MKIGIFDSGIGGLNVLDEFLNNKINAEFIYLGDNLNVPYGTKTKEELEIIIKKIFKFFEKQNVDAIFIACNTASCASIDLKCSVPVYRIIEPTCKIAKEVNKKNNKPIALLATNFTVSSKNYDKYIDNLIGVKASSFVPLCEKNLMESDEAKEEIKKILECVKGKSDTIILGCTHFRLLRNQILSFLGKVNVVDSCSSFNNEIKKLVGNNQKDKYPIPHIFFTKPDKLNISWFHHEYQGIDFIDLE